MTSPRHHIETIQRIAAGALPPSRTERGLIHRSWHRCVNQHGLDPAANLGLHVEMPSRLRESRERMEDYLQVARAGMEQLFKRVRDIGYVLLLTDADGITVDFIGNDAWGIDARRAGLHLGANWHEPIAGTNGIGTCIVEQVPLTCHREEHFYLGNLGLSCNTAPLFDPDGQLLGVLDVSALATPDARESQHLALHLTTLYGQMIEDSNFIRHFRERWILRLATSWALVDVLGDMMLAFDGEGRLVGANTGARRWLAAATDLPPDGSRALTDLFRCRLDEIWRLTRPSHAMDRALLTAFDDQLYYASVIPPRAPSPAATAGGAVAALPPPSLAPQHCPALDGLAGDDKKMRALIEQAKRLANKPVNILIQGETGTGKEVLAKALHRSSRRADKAFVAVNCAAIPESLIESELFGYTAGTFTGARSRGMRGLIVQADGGTLFLDEIGDMPLHLQTRLLRVLSEKEVLPLGADRPVRVELSVIAASHRDLRRLIAAGSFREDLYYRICGATLALPALRERADLPHLVDRILAEEAERLEMPAHLHEEALDVLLAHDWPGNVRELRNALRFALAVSDGQGIQAGHLPPEVAQAASARLIPSRLPTRHANAARGMPPAGGASFGPAGYEGQVGYAGQMGHEGHEGRVGSPGHAGRGGHDGHPGRADSAEARALLEALRRHRWNISAVATEAGVWRKTIYRRMERLGIRVPPRGGEDTGP